MDERFEQHMTTGRAAYLQQQFDAAAQAFAAAVKANDQRAEGYNGLGAALHKLRRYPQAEVAFRQALQLQPNLVSAVDNLGIVLRLQHRFDDATACHKKALRLDPNYSAAQLNLALALEDQARYRDAQEAFEKAIGMDAAMARAHAGLGRVLAKLAKFAEAEAALHKALEIDPELPMAHTELASILNATGRMEQALKLYKYLRRRLPERLDIRLGLAATHTAMGRDDLALRICHDLQKQGVQLPLLDLQAANALAGLGRINAARKLYRTALAQLPLFYEARGNYLFMLSAAVAEPPAKMLRELEEYERACNVAPEQRIKQTPRNRDPDRKLRIGYVSGDFRQHVVRQFFEPVVCRHTDANVEVFCYSQVPIPDFATQSIRWVSDHWCNIFGRGDEEVAKQIDRDGIDILVDLAGHTAHNRLRVFAYKPAPVQVTHLGYFGSTGLSTIDYWLTDEVLHPLDTREPAVESIWRLPRCCFVYGFPNRAPPIVTRPDSRGDIVFGCFNNASKVGYKVIDSWCEILRRCKGSRLILKDRRFRWAAIRRNWQERFARRGFGTDRVELRGPSPHLEYLKEYGDIDIALDPFPRTGGTTTCDAIAMGVPVVTLAGDRYVQRLSATKLTAVGLQELIADSVDGYVDLAVSLAHDPQRRNLLRKEMRPRLFASPLSDPRSLVESMESAYRQMWHNYLDSEGCKETQPQ